jgi:3-hydroxybutyryl-CoA dehydrogenase
MNLKDIKKIMVVGAGTMGHSIAQVYAQSGYKVDLIDQEQKILEKSKKRIESNLNLLEEYKRVSADEVPAIMNRISFSTDLKSAANTTDYVVEAVNEDRQIKKEVFSQLDKYCSEDILFASNTSELNIFLARYYFN